MKAVILETITTDYDDVSWSAVEKLVSCKKYSYTGPGELEDRVRDADLIILNKTRVDKVFLDLAPKCKAIFVLATGFDNIDLQACTERGIHVYNVQGYSTPSVVQYVVANIFNHLHRLNHYHDAVGSGVWSKKPVFSFVDHTIRELSGIKLGIVGMGKIGQALYRSAKALGLSVHYYTRSVRSWESVDHLDYCALDDLFEDSDFVSLHVPLTEDTHSLVDRRLLSLMKEDAVLINSSRGGVINDQDLRAHLADNPRFTAYLDTLDQEPPAPDHPLLNIPNCRITPHLAWCSVESRQRLIDLTAANIHNFMTTKDLSLNTSTIREA